MAFLSFGKREGKMKTQIKNEINAMRLAGAKASEIASHLGIPASTVRTHIRRHPEIPNTVVCPTCGKRVMLGANGRKKKYCSDRCRMAWWNSHPEAIRRKAKRQPILQRVQRKQGGRRRQKQPGQPRRTLPRTR